MRKPEQVERNAEGLSVSIERHLRDYFAAHEHGLPASGLYDRVLQEIERPLLAITLDECRGNQLRAAALLGLNRNTLRKKIRELGLDAERRTSRSSRVGVPCPEAPIKLALTRNSTPTLELRELKKKKKVTANDE